MLPPNLPPARHRARPQPAPPPIVAAKPPTAKLAEPQPGHAAAYEVGYGKPPVHSRFQPGRSGNPKGRPKHARNVDTLIREVLDERIVINTPNGPRRLTRVEVLVRKLVEMSAKGNMRAMEQLLRQYAQAQAQAQATAATTGGAPGTDPGDLTATDEMSLTLLRQLLLAELGDAADGTGAAS